MAQPIEAMTALTPISLIAVPSSTPLWAHALVVDEQRYVAYAVIYDHSPRLDLHLSLFFLNVLWPFVS